MPGQLEIRLERAAAVWRRRCQGTSMITLAREFDLSLSTIHSYIEEQRALLRQNTEELASREREQALELIDNAIEKIVPHINGDIVIETEIDRPGKSPIVLTVQAWQARIQACAALVKLLDRKAKLLGMDAPVKVEPLPAVPPESEEARAREALKLWCKFSVNPQDFQSRDLS